MTNTDEVNAAIAAKWNEQTVSYKTADPELRTRWWRHPYVLRQVNERICGQRLPGWGGGIHQLIKDRYGELLPFGRGVSVGGGAGGKEMDVLRAGIVEHMTVYELASVRIDTGRELAEKSGLADRITFVEGDAFALEQSAGTYDLVHWDNSLHHMMDVPAAVDWSANVLRRGGLFYMYDFVGPSRFQWTAEMLRLATAIRRALPPEYLVDPNNPQRSVTRDFTRPPSIESMIAMDPSEAADSSRILASVEDTFPEAEVKLTGGIVYSLAFNDIIHHMRWDPLDPVLALGMLLDFQAADNGLTHYATAVALKR